MASEPHALSDTDSSIPEEQLPAQAYIWKEPNTKNLNNFLHQSQRGQQPKDAPPVNRESDNRPA